MNGWLQRASVPQAPCRNARRDNGQESRSRGRSYRTHRLRRAGEAELVSEAPLGLVGVSLDQVGHRSPGALAVNHLCCAVVWIHDVGPGDVPEIFASL